jgi:hypothetical protein
MENTLWHEPRPSLEHYQWFQNLIDFQKISQNWLKDLRLDKPNLPHHLKRAVSPKIRDRFFDLGVALTPQSIDQLHEVLDDAHPFEFLSRLEHTVWSFQAWTLRNIFENTLPEEKEAVRNLLEQSAWKSGRTCAEERWMGFSNQSAQDLTQILGTFLNCPLWNSSQSNPFLTRRVLPNLIEIELFHCPHQTPYLEVEPSSHELCHLHSHWIRGFIYSLNTKVIVEHTVRSSEEIDSRCYQRWRFHSDQTSGS